MLRLNKIEITAYSHATEDEDKVLTALFNLIPKEIRDNIKLFKQRVKGHYGNDITILRATIPSKIAVSVLKYIAENMNDVEKSVLRASLRLRYDERNNKLYLRFDKQSLYSGKIVVSDSNDIVHLVVSFSGRGGFKEVQELLRNIGLI